MDLSETLTLQALKLKQISSMGASDNLVDSLVDQHPQALRQICARISPALYEEVSNMCHLLDMSQRQFIELALVDAVEKANQTLTANGVWDVIDSKGGN